MNLVLRSAARLWSQVRPLAVWTRTRRGRPNHPPPAWEAGIVDDVAFNRPWNLLIKVLRIQAYLRRSRLEHGSTIVIVNWNTLPVLQDTLWAVQAMTPAQVRVMVVDNGSGDGSREWLSGQHNITTIPLLRNAGHAIALDIALLLVRTKTAITLDSDAVPLGADWTDTVLKPLQKPNVVLAGLRSSRDFVHPVFAAVDVRTFIERRLSFQVWQAPNVSDEDRVWGENCWDTGELMTSRLDASEVAFIDPTPNPVDGLPGMTTGSVVYHHGGITRATEGAGDGLLDEPSYQEWQAALAALLPPTAVRLSQWPA